METNNPKKSTVMETKRQSEVKYLIRKLCDEVNRIIDLPGTISSTALFAYLYTARTALLMAQTNTEDYKEEMEERVEWEGPWNK